MQEILLKRTAVCSTIFTVLAVLSMILFQWNREDILRYDAIRVGTVEVDNYEEVVSEGTASGFIAADIRKTDCTNVLQLQCPQEIKDAELQYDYANRYIYIWLPDMTEKQWKACSLNADEKLMDITGIGANWCMRDGVSGIRVEIPMFSYCTGSLKTESNQLTAEFTPIMPTGQLTIVLDAGHGGEDTGDSFLDVTEKDMTLKIVKEIISQLQSEDIRVFSTRYDDVYADEEDRVAFANAIKADALIGIHYSFLQEEAEGRRNGLTAIYNGKYFIPDFGSIELANILEEEAIKKVGGVANGLYQAEEENRFINGARIPVAIVEIDNVLTNDNVKSITTDKYIERVAEGICDGILRMQQEQ